MIIPVLFIRWFAVAVLIAIGLLFIILVLFGAAMDSLIAPTQDEGTCARFLTKKETGYDTLTG